MKDEDFWVAVGGLAMLAIGVATVYLRERIRLRRERSWLRRRAMR